MGTEEQAPPPRHFVLVPGFWLGAWAWDLVSERLRAHGHAVTAVTLPGLESPDADRSGITRDDLVSHVTRQVEKAAADGHPVVLAGHSGSGPIVDSVVGRVPDLVSRTVYVDSGPLPEGEAMDANLPDDVVELPFPGWDQVEAEGTSTDGLDDATRAEVARRAVAQPASSVREVVPASDPRRRDVPVTVVCSSFTAEVVTDLVTKGHPFFAGLRGLLVSYVDLPTGHWPMFSRPDALADVLLAVPVGAEGATMEG